MIDKPLIEAQLESLYKNGGDPDIVYITLENAHDRHLIGCFEYQWRRLLQRLHIPQAPIRSRTNPFIRPGRFIGVDGPVE